MFDGTWATIQTHNIKLIYLKEPNHTMPNRFHFLKHINGLLNKGVLKRKNNSKWSAPPFIIAKNNGTVHSISDFRELKDRIKRKPFQIPKIRDLLWKLEGFKYATSFDLNKGYYCTKLYLFLRKLYTIVLCWG